MNLTHLPEGMNLAHLIHSEQNDFREVITAQSGITVIDDDSGASAAGGDAAGGKVTLTTGATDNNEVYIHGTHERYLFADGKPCVARFLHGFTEANTNDANIFMGVVNAVAANLIVDDGAGPKTTASGMGFEKRDGETVWRTWSSLSTTQTSTDLTAANKNNLSGVAQTAGTAGPTIKLFEIEFQPETSTKGYVLFKIDNTLVARHSITYTGATEMQWVIGAKAGDANSETPIWKYAGVCQKR